MNDIIPPNPRKLKEALEISEEIIRNIELTELPLSQIALKASRLARLLNDFDYQRIMEYESGGYPSGPDGIPQDIFNLAILAGRTYEIKDTKGDTKEYAKKQSIEQIENELEAAKIRLTASADPDISISSANPDQYVINPRGNQDERQTLNNTIRDNTELLSNRRSFIYQYALKKNHELKFSEIVSDAFSRKRETADRLISKYIPSATKKFTAIYENLLSDNPEDWSNAVHSCRRILQDLADSVFPAQSENRVVYKDGEKKEIKLGKENYINRLVAFIEDKNESMRYEEIVGSHLEYLGNRLDAIFKAAQKGTHDTIMSREEADRYVIYTYMIVTDVLSLKNQVDNSD